MTRNKIAKFKSTGRPKQTQVAGQDELGNIECTALLTLSEVKEEIARNNVKNPIPETVKRAHEFVDAEPHKSHVTTGWHSNGCETVAFACLYAQGYFVDFGDDRKSRCVFSRWLPGRACEPTRGTRLYDLS
jgi:hypothetical protein